MSENDLLNRNSIGKKLSSFCIADEISSNKDLLPYEIEISSSKNNNIIIFPLCEKMRYNKMKELVPYDKYIGRYIITRNIKFNNSNNNTFLWKINAIDNRILKLENINNISNNFLHLNSNTAAYKNNPIDLGDKENLNKVFLVELIFISKNNPDNFIFIVSNFCNGFSLITKESNGEINYTGFILNLSTVNYQITSETGLNFEFCEKLKSNTFQNIKQKFSNKNIGNTNKNSQIFGGNNLGNNNLNKNISLFIEINKVYKEFLRNIEYKEIDKANLSSYILKEISINSKLYLLLDYNAKFNSYLLKSYLTGKQSWESLEKNNNNNTNNNIENNNNYLILGNILKGLVCISSILYDNGLNSYEFENTVTVPLFDNLNYESKIILNNRKELLSHFSCAKCMYKINNFESYLCQTCKKLYHVDCIEKDENKNPLLYKNFFCNNINCSPCVICKSNQSQSIQDKYQCKKCKFVFHGKCLYPNIRNIYMNNLNHENFLCENCIKCCKCGLNAYNLNIGKKDNKFICEKNMCSYCDRKKNKKEYCPICDELWYSKDATTLIECTKCKFSCHKICDRIIPFTTEYHNGQLQYISLTHHGKKNKYHCPSCRINKKILAINGLINDLIKLDTNEYFFEPVDLQAIPNYSKVVKRPICFKDIINNNTIKNDYLKNMINFFDDIYLIVDNAMLFNMPRDPIYEAASELKIKLKEKLDKFKERLYQCSMDFWLFDYNIPNKSTIIQKIELAKKNFKEVFNNYNKRINEDYEKDKKNKQNYIVENKENNKNDIEINEKITCSLNFIQEKILEYNVTWSWLTEFNLRPYDKSIKESHLNNFKPHEFYDFYENLNNNQNNDNDNDNVDNNVSININTKINYNNFNNNKTYMKKKFKPNDDIFLELDYHNSNFEASKKNNKISNGGNNMSRTMDLILNEHNKMNDLVNINENLFNNYEKNIDNDKKIAFLYPDKFRFYFPTKLQNLKNCYNDFMSSFILKIDDNKKIAKLKKKENNFSNKDLDLLDDGDDYNPEDKNDQDYTLNNKHNHKNGTVNNKKLKSKKKKLVNSTKLKQKHKRDSFNSDINLFIDDINSDKNTATKSNNKTNKDIKNQNTENIIINNEELTNININNENEYSKKEIKKKLSFKLVTVCFKNINLIFAPNCCLCGSFEEPEKIIICAECENTFHYYCIDPGLDLKKIKELNNWRCSFCKKCEKCNQKIIGNNDLNILYCKSCDNCYHIKCLPFIMNTDSYKFKCEKCFKCINCNSNKYYSDKFPINQNKDYSFFTRDYDYCYECGLVAFYNSLCAKCQLLDFKNYSKKLFFIKDQVDFDKCNFNFDIFDENIEKNMIIMLYCDTCKSWYHSTCLGLDYLSIKEYFNKFKNGKFNCLDCYLKNNLGDKYYKLSVITYLEILTTSFKLMVLSKLIMIILKGHYKDLNSSVKLHSKLIKTFIKNNYNIILQNKNIQILMFLFKLDIFLVREPNTNANKKNKNKNILKENQENNKINTENKENKENKEILVAENNNNNNIEANKNNKENNIDKEVEQQLYEIYKKENMDKIGNNNYFLKHINRLLNEKIKKENYNEINPAISDIINDIKTNCIYQKDSGMNPELLKLINSINENRNGIFYDANKIYENNNKYDYCLLDEKNNLDKNKYNKIFFQKLDINHQSEMNYNIRNFNNENIFYNDYPSDAEYSSDNELKIKNTNNILLGNKTKNPNQIDDNTNNKDKTIDEVSSNNKKYYKKYGDKKLLSKIFKKYLYSMKKNNPLNYNNENFNKSNLPKKIIDMYEYNVEDYLKLNINPCYTNTYIEHKSMKIINDLFNYLSSIKNNNKEIPSKKINYSKSINTFILRICFESIKFIRELLLKWLINSLLEESSNNIFKNLEDVISKCELETNNINNEELEKYFDSVDKLLDSPNSQQECVLCHRKGGREISGRLIYLKENSWIHINCLYWSKNIIVNNENELNQIDVIFNKYNSFKCHLCKKNGATLCCHAPKCERKYHFLCGYLKKCSFSKDNRVFCNRCAHCHKDETEEVIRSKLNKLFILKSKEKEKDILPKYQVGVYNKTGNSTILKFILFNEKDYVFESLDLAIIKIKYLSNYFDFLGINENGTLYIKNVKFDGNKIKNYIGNNYLNNCTKKSDFLKLIKECGVNEFKDKNINNNNCYVLIHPMKNIDSSLNFNYCKNKKERDENVEYILFELNKNFLNSNNDNEYISSIKNHENNTIHNQIINQNNNNNHILININTSNSLEIFKYFYFQFDIKKIYTSSNPIPIVRQYLVHPQGGSYNDYIYFSLSNNKDTNENNENILSEKNKNDETGEASPKTPDYSSEVNSISVNNNLKKIKIKIF